MISEVTKNFPIAITFQSHKSKYSNKPTDKHCEHCNSHGHTTENCRIANIVISEDISKKGANSRMELGLLTTHED